MSRPRIADHYQQLADSVAQFAREVVAPVAAEHDEAKTFPYDVVRQMGEAGYFGLPSRQSRKRENSGRRYDCRGARYE